MMMNVPLTVPMMFEHAERYFSKKLVISRTAGGIHRFTYGEIAQRTRRLAHALEKLGIQKGDRVGTLAWNHHRHLEAYFAIPSIGAVLHTINIRLSPQQIAYIINHAEDKVLLIDPDILPLVEAIVPHLSTVKAFVIMSNTDLPNSPLKPLYSYETLLAESDPSFPFLSIEDENQAAGMCYTSATTGNPKGVVYTHRSIVLHAMALGLADSTAVSERDTVLTVVPMFHVNAWGLPFACVWFGSTQVLPGPYFTPQLLAELIESEQVTVTGGVPTIWLGLLKELEQKVYDLSSLRGVLCGGSAAPLAMVRAFEEKWNVPFYHAYGMTETSPLVSFARLKSYQDGSEEDRIQSLTRQGYMVQGIEMKVVGAAGEVKWDDKEMGELLLRGPWIASEYYRDERSGDTFLDGWLHTGDVVTVDEEGSIKVVDRTKDLIKSGGEWISSVDLENTLMTHEAVFEACVVGIPHEKWEERPLACIVLQDLYKGQNLKREILEFLHTQFAKWWIPDDIVFVDEIPKSGVGKFLKRELREQWQDYYVGSTTVIE
ncbi:fatty-acyl-CoA synthase [Thermoactinomyces sp. DSM 45892]|nr:fatty-acyl-CoA synthase [Thermoactinomyces sp. DSM 45892]